MLENMINSLIDSIKVSVLDCFLLKIFKHFIEIGKTIKPNQE